MRRLHFSSPAPHPRAIELPALCMGAGLTQHSTNAGLLGADQSDGALSPKTHTSEDQLNTRHVSKRNKGGYTAHLHCFMVYDELSHAFLRIVKYCVVITTALKGKCSSYPNVTQKGSGTERLWFTQGLKSS